MRRLLRSFCDQLNDQIVGVKEDPELVTLVLDGKTYTPKLAKMREFARNCGYYKADEGITTLIHKVVDGEMQ